MQAISQSTISKNHLEKIVRSFSHKKILVIGDLILDEYLLGYPSRISREAPVLILKYLESKYALGGAANAACNLASLSSEVTLIGLLGEDHSASVFCDLCKKNNINLRAIYNHKPTTTKTRIITSSNANPDNGTSFKQQVLRIDRENQDDIDPSSQSQLIKEFEHIIPDFDIVLLSDYNNGLFSLDLTLQLTNFLKKLDKNFIVDSTGDFNKFKGAYSLTPNQPDLEKFLQCKIENDNDLLKKAQLMKSSLEASELLVTRGAKGMLLITKDESYSIPAFNLSEVFDVTGAGDTVAATYSLALALGADSLSAATLGNLAASLVVKKPGTATVSETELLEAIERL